MMGTGMCRGVGSFIAGSIQLQGHPVMEAESYLGTFFLLADQSSVREGLLRGAQEYCPLTHAY